MFNEGFKLINAPTPTSLESAQVEEILTTGRYNIFASYAKDGVFWVKPNIGGSINFWYKDLVGVDGSNIRITPAARRGLVISTSEMKSQILQLASVYRVSANRGKGVLPYGYIVGQNGLTLAGTKYPVGEVEKLLIQREETGKSSVLDRDPITQTLAEYAGHGVKVISFKTPTSSPRTSHFTVVDINIGQVVPSRITYPFR